MAKDVVAQVGRFELRGISKSVAHRVASLSLDPLAVASGRSDGQRLVACVVTRDRVFLVRDGDISDVAVGDVAEVGPGGIRTKDGRELHFQAYTDEAHTAFMQAVATTAGVDAPIPTNSAAPPVPLLTLPHVPGAEVSEALGLVTALSVISRNALSDLGSDLMSTFGGNLGGVEKAIGSAVEQAKVSLYRRARDMQADAIIGVHMGLESVADKAQAVLITGTAVRVRRATQDS